MYKARRQDLHDDDDGTWWNMLIKVTVTWNPSTTDQDGEKENEQARKIEKYIYTNKNIFIEILLDLRELFHLLQYTLYIYKYKYKFQKKYIYIKIKN